MTDDKESLKAACYCGNFKLVVPILKSSLPLSATLCHCEPCRRSSGALCNTYVRLSHCDFSPDPAVLGRLCAYKSSEKITRYFCGTCSCHVLWHGPGESDWDIATGCLERVEGLLKFTEHIFIESTIDGGFSDWLTDPSIKRHATFKDELKPGWRGTEHAALSDPSGRLHAHCACGGVEMFIARPSPSSGQTSAPWPDVLVPHDSGPANLSENETWWLRSGKQKFLAGICACNSCRLMNGFEFIEWAFIPTGDISLDRDGKIPFSRSFGTLAAYRSSEGATKRFCSECGATVFWDGDVRPGLIDVAVGLLDAPEGARAESWLEWRTERVSFREDAAPRANGLIEGLEKALGKWGKEVQGRSGQNHQFLEAHDGRIDTGGA